MSSARILVVDDDPQICELLQQYLQPYSYEVLIAHNGMQMQRVLREKSVDLVILDVMLPGDDGVTICRKLRETSDVSIIMLSAVGEESDRIIGLEVGADDYLTKPFSPRELLARIKALLRRASGDLGESRRAKALAQLPNIVFNDWVLDRKKRCLVSPEQLTVPLSQGEYAMLEAFIESPGRILSRDHLLDFTQGRSAEPFDRSVDVQVARLRKKLERDPKHPKLIITVRGGGYRFTATVTEEK